VGANRAVVVRHVTRIEGHGNIVVELEGDTIKRCDLEIVEAPRFFEALLVGRPYDEAPRISCRICGICSVGHATASVHAVESALGITPGPKLRLVRRLNMAGEWLQSHILHVCFLVAPDALDVPSIVPLVGSHPDVVKRALRLKRLANDICCTVSGRHVMPISYHAGWMGHWPDREELRTLQEGLVAGAEDLDATVELFAGITWPAVERRAEHLASLEPGGAYPMMGGPLHSSSGAVTPPEAYRDALHEYVVDHSAAKHVRGADGTVRVGALARYGLAHGRLHPRAAEAAARLKLRPDSANPFDFVAAQLVESVQAHQEAVDAVTALLVDPAPEDPVRPTRPQGGRGVGMVEVPRGTLVHDYVIGADGRLTAANCVIPTSQNLSSIEADMRAFLPQLLRRRRPDAEIAHGLEMLVRAYDPCVSCSVH